jgi:DNA polymerase (family 10)
MLNGEIATIFERMARLLAYKQADRFRIIAYERAAVAIRQAEDVAVLDKEDRLQDIPGVGEDLSGMIREYIRTGKIRKCEQERKGLPDELIDLMTIPGLGPKTVALLQGALKIENLEDLKRAIDSGALLKLPGFREKKVQNIARSIELWVGGRERIALGVALPLAEGLLADIRKERLVEEADLAGSLRRGRETIGDVDVVIAAKDSARALSKISKLPPVKRVLALGETKATFVIVGPVQVDVRAVDRSSYGAALLYFTGSKEHNVRLRTMAKDRGWKLSEYGVFAGERMLGGATEEEVYRLLGLPFIPPELREDRGEIEAARKKELPNLVELADLRGDLHVHTNYSDGRDTAEQVVDKAAALGYEYVALSDHSPAARIAHGLEEERVGQKIAEIERLRRSRKPGKPEILMGAEVDIRGDGTLDYPERTLKKLDVVIAAVHAGFRQDSDRMTGRLLDALDCPYVHVLAHPTGRLLGAREPIQFDFKKVLKKALDRKIALEINGSWQRLDLNDTMARAAQDAGVLLNIGSDAHSTGQMEYVRYAVTQARRGWIEAKPVVNTWTLPKLKKWLKRS